MKVWLRPILLTVAGFVTVFSPGCGGSSGVPEKTTSTNVTNMSQSSILRRLELQNKPGFVAALRQAEFAGEFSGFDRLRIMELLNLGAESGRGDLTNITTGWTGRQPVHQLTEIDFNEMAELMLPDDPTLRPDDITSTWAETYGGHTFAKVVMQRGRRVFYFLKSGTNNWQMCGSTTSPGGVRP